MHSAPMLTGAHCDFTPLRSFRLNDTLTPTEPIPPPPTSVNSNLCSSLPFSPISSRKVRTSSTSSTSQSAAQTTLSISSTAYPPASKSPPAIHPGLFPLKTHTQGHPRPRGKARRRARSPPRCRDPPPQPHRRLGRPRLLPPACKASRRRRPRQLHSPTPRPRSRPRPPVTRSSSTPPPSQHSAPLLSAALSVAPVAAPPPSTKLPLRPRPPARTKRSRNNFRKYE